MIIFYDDDDDDDDYDDDYDMMTEVIYLEKMKEDFLLDNILYLSHHIVNN